MLRSPNCTTSRTTLRNGRTWRRAIDQVAGSGAGATSEQRVDAETAQKLAALGYVGDANRGIGAIQETVRADPKQMVAVFNRLREANAAVQRGDFGVAAGVAQNVLRRDPENGFAMLVLANAVMEQGRYREAIAHYRRYANLVPTSAEAHHRIAICLARLGEPSRALDQEDVALAIDPR